MRSIAVDPQAYLYANFAGDQVPRPEALGQYWNRVQDPGLDQTLAAAAGTLDSRKKYVQGWGPTNINDTLTWNIQDWWLSR